MSGRSTTWPALKLAISRSCWAWAQVSGEAEPAAWPLRKPIEATVGSVPYGSAARVGSSQACSGTRPTPEAEFSMKCSCDRAIEPSPWAKAVSARSPDSTGHR